jgi:hypothetical protein
MCCPSDGSGTLQPDDAVEYATFFSRSHHAVIRVYDEAANVIQTHKRAGDQRVVNAGLALAAS